MPVTVHKREVPDAGLYQVVPHPLGLLRARVRIVDKRPVSTMDHISGHANIHGAKVSPVVGTVWRLGFGRSTVVEAEQMIIEFEHTHVHLGRVTDADRQKG